MSTRAHRPAQTLCLLIVVLATPVPAFAQPDRPALELHVDSTGTGPTTIVFLAGLGATSSYWKAHVGQLKDSYRLLMPDPLGFGRSRRPDTVYSIERHMRALEPVLADRDPVVLVGHSFGALVASRYAAAHPDRVRALVLIGTPVYASKSDAVAQLGGGNAFKRWILSHRTSTAFICRFTRSIARPMIPLLAPNLPEDVRDDATAHTARASSSSLHDGLYSVNGFDLLRSIPRDLSVLVIHGEKDQTAPWRTMQQALAERPEWQRVVLPNDDHHPVLRSPKAVMDAILLFAGER
jgi:pimeloyl-ACP methyl ester carboxylesterase